MSKRGRRQFAAEQKLQILLEAEQPNVSVTEVCRRHGLAVSVFYRWRAVAKNGSAKALRQDAKRGPSKNDQDARREAQLVRLRAVIAEIIAENLGLKKDLKLNDLARIPAESKAEVLRIVAQTKKRSGWSAHQTLSSLGIPRSVYHGWKRRESLEDRQWPADVMHVWVAARFYFLVSFVDACSRYIVHHKLLLSLDGQSVATEHQAALDAAGDVRPRIGRVHGSEFVNRDVAAVMKAHNSTVRCVMKPTTTVAITACRPRRSLSG